jgi:hypothetical protein
VPQAIGPWTLCEHEAGVRPEPEVDAEVEALSLAWEVETGCDSIPTIRRLYDRSPSGVYLCIWPGCSWGRRNPEQVWRHVHTVSHGGVGAGLPPNGWDPSKRGSSGHAEPESAERSPNPTPEGSP